MRVPALCGGGDPSFTWNNPPAHPPLFIPSQEMSVCSLSGGLLFPLFLLFSPPIFSPPPPSSPPSIAARSKWRRWKSR